MISHQHKCIFVHIPRTGGTSIEDVIWGPDRRSRTEAQLWMGIAESGRNKYQTGGLQHLLARQIRQEVGPAVFDAVFKFSFVRNPWDKAVSQFIYMRKRRDLRELVGMRHDSTFKDYLMRIEKVRHVQWYGQWEFLLDDNGDLLVDCVGRFESFDKDVQSVLSRLGIVCDAVPHEFKGDRLHYETYYDQESLEIVGHRYRRDIERFGYTSD